MTYLAAYLLAAIATAILTPLVIRVARAKGLVDLPDARKMHRAPTPRVGGVAIFVALVVSALPMVLFRIARGTIPAGASPQLCALLCTSLAIFVVGLVDDLVSLPSKIKLAALLAAATGLCAAGVRIHSISFGDWMSWELGVLAWPATVLWIVGVTVAINFIDGLDGLAAGIAAVVCGILAIIAAHTGQAAAAILALALLGSLTAFLIFNFNPAKIFMGDCGSMLVGFILASVSVMCTARVRTLGLALPALALSVPILDTFTTLLRRGVLERRSLFSAERGHVHHGLIDRGLDHRRTVILLHAVTILCGASAVVLLFARQKGVILTLGAAMALLLLGLFRFAGSVRPGQVVLAVRRNFAISRSTHVYRRRFEELQMNFRRETSFEGWWKQVSAAAEAMGFANLSLSTINRDGSPRLLTWRRCDATGDPQELLSVALPIRHRRSSDPISMQIDVDTMGSFEDAGRRISLFGRLMEEHSLETLPQSGDEAQLRARGSKAGNIGSTLDDAADVSLTRRSSPLLPATTRVAVVHDFLYTYAGAEKVLEQILRVFPDAQLFSLFDFLPAGQREFIQNKTVRTSFIQKLPFARRNHRRYLPLMPMAIEQLDVSDYDLVISSSYVAAKGVITRPGQLHISYCHSPVRFAWDLQNQYLDQSGIKSGIKSLLVRALFHYIRNWDMRSADRVDVFATNSRFVSRRVEKCYRRRSTPIYPPVDIARFSIQPDKEDFYLTASRMVPYKKIDLIVQAFAQWPDRRLIVVGDGPDFAKIKAIATPNVRLVGHVSFERLRGYMQRARGFVFAAEEDFGITPVEAQACGTPVIAYGRGGVAESVVDGRTGVFFQEQTVPSILDALTRFEAGTWDPYVIRENSRRFSAENFRNAFFTFVETEWAAFESTYAEQTADDLAPARGPRDRASNGHKNGAPPLEPEEVNPAFT
jgi:UDP-N-acetylmuramyl pentapeptide phosphotransferase/UDP-N-acetylglucosamine-1-phosphate transferase/glycosyltransferase involved in cell wall biosynthesis